MIMARKLLRQKLNLQTLNSLLTPNPGNSNPDSPATWQVGPLGRVTNCRSRLLLA